MRISTGQIQRQGIAAVLEQQAQLTKTQLQLSTGKRVLTPADDPAAASLGLELNQTLAVNRQYQANADSAKTRLGNEEVVLDSVTSLLQNVRTLAVQGNNATLGAENRAAIAVEVRQRLEELLGYANSRDGNGEYLFAGHQGQTQPFASTAAGTFTYSGDQGQRYLQIGPTRQLAVGDSGTEVFQTVRNGNGTFVTNYNAGNSGSGVINPGTVSGTFVPDTYTLTFTQVLSTDPITYTVTRASDSATVDSGSYTSGAAISFAGVQTSVSGTPANGDTFIVTPSANQDMFTTLQNLANALTAPTSAAGAQAKLNNNINRALTDIDQALGNILEVRAQVGARLNAIDAQKDLNSAFTLEVQKTLASVQDIDYAEAASRLNSQLIALQAAQQTYVKVQGLSLFDFLR